MLIRLLQAYVGSWWLPTAVFFGLLGGFTLVAASQWQPVVILVKPLLIAATIGLVGVLAAAGWNLLGKNWLGGLANLCLLPVCLGTALLALAFVMVSSMFGPSEDGFADSLTIPAEIEVVDPQPELDVRSPGEPDAFQVALLTALAVSGDEDVTVTGKVTSLKRLQATNPVLLRRYLASNPAWRVFQERGNVFATRRWVIGPTWHFTLHGYYSQHTIDPWSVSEVPAFQTRFTIGLDGKPWWRGDHAMTRLKAGEKTLVQLRNEPRSEKSHVVVETGPLAVEVFEESNVKERRLTKAALSFVEQEFAALLAEPSWEASRELLPTESIRVAEPSLELRASFQPGIYDSVVWVNPGEAGMVYLKAFEVTHGTPLSADRLKEASNEWVGWSGNPQEVFFSNTTFTIFEGDWGKPYAARFELWFSPDSGAPDRKMMEKVLRIEGWQR